MTMRFISWNIMHPAAPVRLRAVRGIIEELKPDLVAMQEVLVEQTKNELNTRMREIGLKYVLFQGYSSGRGLLVASRWEMKSFRKPYLSVRRGEEKYFRDPPYKAGERLPARMLSVKVNREGTPFLLHNVHIPYGTDRGWRKIDTFRATTRRLARTSDIPQILCGDFNEPREEKPDKSIVTWAYYNEYSKAGNPVVWDEAVKAIFEALPKRGIEDAVRCVLGDDVIREVSYPLKRNGKPRRYDHVFASKELKPVEASYIKVPRYISDHYPVLVVFKM